MTTGLLLGLVVFVLASFVGFEVINKVPPTLHTPLMSGANAISAGSLFYWVGESIITLKDYLKKNNINIRVK